jgi:hypothetical protein
MSFGLVCGVGSPGQKLVPGQNYRVDRMAETGLYEDAKRGIRRVIDPHLRVKDAALDGVDAEVIFGILGAATRLGDDEAAREMFRISRHPATRSLHAQLAPDLLAVESGALQRADDQGHVLLGEILRPVSG